MLHAPRNTQIVSAGHTRHDTNFRQRPGIKTAATADQMATKIVAILRGGADRVDDADLINLGYSQRDLDRLGSEARTLAGIRLGHAL